MSNIRTEYKRVRASAPTLPARQALHFARESLWIDKQEKRTDINIEIIIEPDYLAVRGNAVASGDGRRDKRIEDEIIDRLESGDVWAWADVEVRVSLLCSHCDSPIKTASNHLGGCSYADEAGFRAGGYYGDMIADCLAELDAE